MAVADNDAVAPDASHDARVNVNAAAVEDGDIENEVAGGAVREAIMLWVKVLLVCFLNLW